MRQARPVIGERVSPRPNLLAGRADKLVRAESEFGNSPPPEGCPKGGVVEVRKTKHYKSLPFNPDLKARARQLRQGGMLHEALMWNRLKQGQLNGLDFDRQKVIGEYIVDFYCAERDVVIELDGPSHYGREDYDERRDSFLKGLGLTVVHIPVWDVLHHMESVVESLRNHPGLAATPTEEGN